MTFLRRSLILPELIEVNLAAKLIVAVQHLLRNNIVPIKNLRETCLDIKVPIGGAISNDHAGKIVSHFFFGIDIVLVELPSQIWGVNSTVAFPCDIKRIPKVLWEVLVPLFKGRESIICLSVIVVDLILFWSVGEANTRWRLKVNDVGVLGPGVRIPCEFCSIIF